MSSSLLRLRDLCQEVADEFEYLERLVSELKDPPAPRQKFRGMRPGSMVHRAYEALVDACCQLPVEQILERMDIWQWTPETRRDLVKAMRRYAKQGRYFEENGEYFLANGVTGTDADYY